jgi:hypothetical protein
MMPTEELDSRYNTLKEAIIYYATCGWEVIVTPIMYDTIDDESTTPPDFQ